MLPGFAKFVVVKKPARPAREGINPFTKEKQMFAATGRGPARARATLSPVDLAELPPEQRAWVEANEALWRRAHEIVRRHPELDASDVYHVLATLHETPSQRVRRSLRHGRLRPRSR